MRHSEVFTGRVGQIRDLKELGNNNCVVSFSVAETPRQKDAQGNWVDGETVWTEVTIFGDEARNFVRSVKPGVFVTVIGTRRARSYTPNDSTEKRVVQSVVADQVAVAITKFTFIESIGNVNYAKDGRPSAPTSQGNTGSTQQSAPTQDLGSDPFAGDPFASSGGGNPFSDDSNPFNS